MSEKARHVANIFERERREWVEWAVCQSPLPHPNGMLAYAEAVTRAAVTADEWRAYRDWEARQIERASKPGRAQRQACKIFEAWANCPGDVLGPDETLDDVWRRHIPRAQRPYVSCGCAHCPAWADRFATAVAEVMTVSSSVHREQAA